MEINSYLLFGYSLNYKNNNYELDLTKIDKTRYSRYNEKELIIKGAKLLQHVVSQQFVNNQQNVVPLSGGVDSRAILAILSEFTELSSINTYTFGTPGTYDYEIGKAIAKYYGTNHRTFSLTKINYKMEELLDTSKRFDFQSPVFIHPPVWEFEKFYKNASIWSGVNAGAVVGSFMMKFPLKSLDDAKKRFMQKGSFVKSIDLCSDDKQLLIGLMKFDSINENLVSFNEQVFIKQRSEKHLAKNVLIEGFNYKTPFINNEFMDFMFSQAPQYRLNKSLYKKIIYHGFPTFFKKGIEGNYGLKINANKKIVSLKGKLIQLQRRVKNKIPVLSFLNSPMLNYIDFDEAIRNRQDMKSIIYENINDLKLRKIIDWIDIDTIWKRHQNRMANFSDALIALSSLEIHLKAKGKQDGNE